MSVTELALKRDQIQVGTISERQAEERWGWGRAVGGMKSFNKHRSACVSLCLCVQLVSICVTSSVPRRKERKKKKKKDFCEKHKAQGGGYGHREKREHQALLLFSALGRVSSPAVSHRSVE